MSHLSVCRICLSTDDRLCSISGTPLQLVFEKITNSRLHVDKWPTSACYICYAQLKRCHRLILTTNSAGKMLVEMLEKHPEVSTEAVAKLQMPQLYALDVTPTEYYDVTAPWCNGAVKMEPECEVDDEDISDPLSEPCFVMDSKVEENTGKGLQQLEDAMVVIPDHNNDTAQNVTRKKDKGREICEQSHQCHVCWRQYSRRDHLLRHLRNVHNGKKRHECDVCKRHFKRRYYYLAHLKTHMDPSQPSSLGTADTSDVKLNNDSSTTLSQPCGVVMNFKVESTGEGSQQSADAMVVIPTPNKDITHHNGITKETEEGRETCTEQSGDSIYQCNVCQRQYYRRDHLLRHLRTTHSGEKPHECDVCKRRFNRKDHYVSHLKTHTGEKHFQCDVCQHKFNRKYLLISHYRTHTGEKPYECEVCQRRFSHKGIMLYHLGTHVGKKLFQCHVCPSRFDKKNSLDTHLLAHAAEKPFVCDICQRGFYQKGNLLLHIRTHTGDEPFDCRVCQRNFKTKSDLLNHSIIHTDEKPYECTDCQSRFKRLADLKRHMLIHAREDGNKFEKS